MGGLGAQLAVAAPSQLDTVRRVIALLTVSLHQLLSEPAVRTSRSDVRPATVAEAAAVRSRPPAPLPHSRPSFNPSLFLHVVFSFQGWSFLLAELQLVGEERPSRQMFILTV
jgi:hypothetical protein